MVWDVRTGKPVAPRFRVRGPVDPNSPKPFDGPVFATFDPVDSRRIYTAAQVVAADQASAHGEVVHWDLRDPQHPRRLGQFDDFPTFFSDGAVISVSSDGRFV